MCHEFGRRNLHRSDGNVRIDLWDLKPENVMIIPDPAMPSGERTKLLDFGIAKLAPAADKRSLKTSTNAVMGTPVYMSPEQCRGAASVDCKSDVYSFGVLLYVMLSGRNPFDGEGSGDIMAKHIYEEPPPLGLHASWVPLSLVDLVHALLVKDKQQRPEMKQVVEALDGLARQTTAAMPRRGETSTVKPNLGEQNQRQDQLSTLGLSAGQTRHWRWERRRLVLSLASAGCLLALATGASLWRSARSRTAGQAHGLEQLQARVQVPPQATIPGGAPVRRPVHWQVRSEPPGAEILRVPDGQVLGRTPWTHAQPAQDGAENLQLRLVGYRALDLSLNRSGDEDVTQVLEATLPPSGSTGKRRSRLGKKLRPAAPVAMSPAVVSSPASSASMPRQPAKPPQVRRTIEE